MNMHLKTSLWEKATILDGSQAVLLRLNILKQHDLIKSLLRNNALKPKLLNEMFSFLRVQIYYDF